MDIREEHSDEIERIYRELSDLFDEENTILNDTKCDAITKRRLLEYICMCIRLNNELIRMHMYELSKDV